MSKMVRLSTCEATANAMRLLMLEVQNSGENSPVLTALPAICTTVTLGRASGGSA